MVGGRTVNASLGGSDDYSVIARELNDLLPQWTWRYLISLLLAVSYVGVELRSIWCCRCSSELRKTVLVVLASGRLLSRE